MIEVRDTWTERDLPVLKAVLVLHEKDPFGAIVERDAVAEATGLSADDVERALHALSPDYVLAEATYGGSFAKGVTARGRQLAGAWPSPEAAFERLLATLDAIASSDRVSEDQRENAKESGSRLRSLGRDLGVGVLGNAIFTGVLAVPGLVM